MRFDAFGAEGRVADSDSIIECRFGVLATHKINEFVVICIVQVGFIGCDANHWPCSGMSAAVSGVRQKDKVSHRFRGVS